MYIYNVTFAADQALETELAQWLRHCFAAESSDAEGISSPTVMRIMAQAEPGTVSLAVHLHADDLADIDNWYADCGSRLFAQALERWGQRVVYFPTVMECL